MATGTVKIQQSGADIVVTKENIFDNVTLAGSTAMTENTYNVTAPGVGYTLIGIVGIEIDNATTSGQGQSAAVVNEFFFATPQNGTPYVSVRLRNVTTSSIKIQCNVQLLWKR